MPRKKKQETEEAKTEAKKEKKETKKASKKKEKKTKTTKTGKTWDKEILKEELKLLVPLADYIGCSVHIGTRVITPSMRKYVYRRKADGLAVINTTMIDEKLKIAADFISQYNTGDIIIVCKREAGWKPVEKFSGLTGIRCFTKKYPAGIITNPDLENFFEPKLLIIVDPWLDKNALRDAVKIHVPIVALCDTNNNTNYMDIVVPCNNKSTKSISLILYVLANLYLKNKGIKTKAEKDDFYKLENREKEREEKPEPKKVESSTEAPKEGV